MNTEKLQSCIEGLKSTSNKLSMLYSTLSDEGRKNTALVISDAIDEIDYTVEFLNSLNGETAKIEEIIPVGSDTKIPYTF